MNRNATWTAAVTCRVHETPRLQYNTPGRGQSNCGVAHYVTHVLVGAVVVLSPGPDALLYASFRKKPRHKHEGDIRSEEDDFYRLQHSSTVCWDKETVNDRRAVVACSSSRGSCMSHHPSLQLVCVSQAASPFCRSLGEPGVSAATSEVE